MPGERIHKSQKSDRGTTGRQASAARQNVQLLKKYKSINKEEGPMSSVPPLQIDVCF